MFDLNVALAEGLRKFGEGVDKVGDKPGELNPSRVETG